MSSWVQGIFPELTFYSENIFTQALFTHLLRTSSAWSLIKLLLLNLKFFWSMSLFSSFMLYYNGKTVGIRSLLCIFSKAYSVYCNIADVVARIILDWKVQFENIITTVWSRHIPFFLSPRKSFQKVLWKLWKII